MHIGLHPKAASELDSVANHLDDDWFGLGERFLQSYHRVTENLKQHPETIRLHPIRDKVLLTA